MSSGSSYTPPKGRPTSGRLERRISQTFWQRWRSEIQWVAILLVLLVAAVVVIAISDPRPIVHGG